MQLNNNQEQVLTFKAKCGEEIRRFSVPASSDWNAIVEKLCTLFSINASQKLTVKYEDDEKDLITIDSTAELYEVKRLYAGQCIRLQLSSGALSASPSERSRAFHPHRSQHFHGSAHMGSSTVSQQELFEKIKLLEDKGYKCKGRIIRLLKIYNGDVDKVSEILVQQKNSKGKSYSEELQLLESKGFQHKGINLNLLRRFDGNVAKAQEFLEKEKKLEEKGYTHTWMNLRLLLKFDGDIKQVEKLWKDKQEKLLKKAQCRREKHMEKFEHRWRKEEKKNYSYYEDEDSSCPHRRKRS